MCKRNILKFIFFAFLLTFYVTVSQIVEEEDQDDIDDTQDYELDLEDIQNEYQDDEDDEQFPKQQSEEEQFPDYEDEDQLQLDQLDEEETQVGQQGQFIQSQEQNDGIEQTRSFSLYGGSKKQKCITRDQIMKRGMRWVKLKVNYNSSQNFEGYRKDCSGFVSMCWKLPKNGPTTRDIPRYINKISKNQLQRGDALNCPSTHVVLFDSWANKAKTQYWGLQDANSRVGTVRRKIPYPFWTKKNCYIPSRYKNVC